MFFDKTLVTDPGQILYRLVNIFSPPIIKNIVSPLKASIDIRRFSGGWNNSGFISDRLK